MSDDPLRDVLARSIQADKERLHAMQVMAMVGFCGLIVVVALALWFLP